MRPQAVDFFCKAGGASKGLHDAGFEMTGVDVAPQPNYPFRFIQADAMELLSDPGFMAQFDAAAASPPCQGYSATRSFTQLDYPDLVAPTRDLLRRSGLPYVIENVEGSPLPAQDTLDGTYGILLCGSMFGLGTSDYKLRRHRLFEPSFPVRQPPDRCGSDPRWTIGVYGKAARARGTTGPSLGMHAGQVALGIDWMTGDELSEAIPPAYTEYIGRHLLERLAERAA